MINLPLILQLRNLHTINATPILFHTEMIKSISLISLGQHLLHCKYIPTSCNQNFFTKKLQLFMSWSIFLFVFSLKINETIHSIRIKQWVQQKQHITHRYGSTYNINADTDISLQMLVSITHRYGSTLPSKIQNRQRKRVSITHRYGSTVDDDAATDWLESKFQSLIGTVQHYSRDNDMAIGDFNKVSITHRYGSTAINL